jgi:hypothetical protein
MPNFIVIKDNKVDNIIDAPSLEVAEEATSLTCIQYVEEFPVAIGYTWDGENFIAPSIEEEINEETTA